MSNYYYDEKERYLATLSHVRGQNHDFTAFLKFGLHGIALQCKRLLKEIRRHVSKSLFRDVMTQMYGRLKSTRKRALADRQLAILTWLLEKDEPVSFDELFNAQFRHYSRLKAGGKAMGRDLNHLRQLNAIKIEVKSQDVPDGKTTKISVRLEWPTEITETEFFAQINTLPTAKTHSLRF
jgi:hypothetical protein